MMPTLSSKQNIHTLVKEIFKYFFDLIPGTWYELWREFRVPTLGFAHPQEGETDDKGKRYDKSSGL